MMEELDVATDKDVQMETIPVQGRTSSNIEFRAVTGDLSGDGNTFVGYAAMFDVPSEPLPFIERIAQGAFGKTLRNRRRDVRMYVNHDSNLLLASKRSGTLRLEEDSTGLRVEADLPNTTYANDLRELMRSGVVDKMSFGFQVPRGGDQWSDDGRERTLRQIELFEVSVVTGFPAYDQTTAAVRSIDRLSTRTGMSVDELTEVLDALADGDSVDPVKADAIIAALKSSVPEPEPEPVNLLGLKQKYLELLAKQV
jgi:HK97 family phage prohead protease